MLAPGQVPVRTMRAALATFNFLALLLVVNAALWAWFTLRDHLHPEGAAQIGNLVAYRDFDQHKAVDLKAYQGVSSQAVDAVLGAVTQWEKNGFAYAPWIGCGISPCQSPLFNIDPFPTDESRLHPIGHGFTDLCTRRIPGAPPASTAAINVYVFGGSTTFGWDVADDWTWPAYLQNELAKGGRPVRVTNFGYPGFYSSQELALFLELLRCGHRPDVVVFLDGFNDCLQLTYRPDVPAFTTEMQTLARDAQHVHTRLADYQWIPMVRLALELKHHVAPPAPIPNPQRVFDVYTRNLGVAQAVCRQSGIRGYFFWQPVAFSDYDFHHHLNPQTFAVLDDPHMVEAYRSVAKTRGDMSLGDWPARFGADRPVFLDLCHYTPGFSEYLGRQLAHRIQLQ